MKKIFIIFLIIGGCLVPPSPKFYGFRSIKPLLVMDEFEAPPLVSIEKFGISNSFPNNIDTLKIEFLLRPAFKTNEMHIKDMKSDTIRISFLLDENPIDFEFVPVF